MDVESRATSKGGRLNLALALEDHPSSWWAYGRAYGIHLGIMLI